MSTFEHLTEDEIREGFADIATAVAENPDQAPLPSRFLWTCLSSRTYRTGLPRSP